MNSDLVGLLMGGATIEEDLEAVLGAVGDDLMVVDRLGIVGSVRRGNHGTDLDMFQRPGVVGRCVFDLFAGSVRGDVVRATIRAIDQRESSTLEVCSADIAIDGDDGCLALIGFHPGVNGRMLMVWRAASDLHRGSEGVGDYPAHDPLTGLLTGERFESLVDSARLDNQSSGDLLAVLLVNIDQMAKVNDTLGYVIGDRVIMCVADSIVDVVETHGSCVRLGRDEFVVVLRTSERGFWAWELAEKLRRLIAQPIAIDGHLVSITASIGLVLAEPGSKSSGGLLESSDIAMHRAQAQGGDAVVVFGDEMRHALLDHMDMIEGLGMGIHRGELVIHYQPVMSAAGDRMCGAEALVRWQHPGHGLLYPDSFIDCAEESGLVIDLGVEVLRQVYADVANWQSCLGWSPHVTVNISASHMGSSRIIDDVLTASRSEGVDPGAVGLEITESALLAHGHETEQVMSSLNEMGVRIDVDDFGTGYASLSQLRRIEVGRLKIDMSFVSGLGKNPADEVIVRTCISLAHGLGFETVAEGVETAAQHEILREMGCDFMQGYLFARPMTADAISVFAVGSEA